MRRGKEAPRKNPESQDEDNGLSCDANAGIALKKHKECDMIPVEN